MAADPGILIVYVNNNSLKRGSTLSLGSFVANTTNTFTVRFSNEGESGTYLIIDKDSSTTGIIMTGSGTLTAPSITEKETVVLEKEESVSFTVRLVTSSIGYKAVEFTVTSNDEAGEFKFSVNFSVVAAQVGSPVLGVLYNNQQIEANSSIDIGDIPSNETEEITLVISNFGTPTLVLQSDGIDLTSMNDTITFSSNPVESSSLNLAFNQTTELKINLGATSLGSKSLIVTILSNDTNENPFVFSITYNVATSYDFIVKYSTQELSDGETVNLGSFNIKTNIIKTITAVNGGSFYNIRVLAVLADGEVTLASIPSLPFILQVNEGNVFQFNAIFSSTSLGRKDASIDIQWEAIS